MQTNGIIGGLYTITEWATRLALTNIVWLLFNIPVLFSVFSLLIVNSMNDIIFIGMITIILLPLFFFPATTAMFSVIRRWIIGEVDVRIILSFWQHYKNNYVRSMVGGLMVILIWVIFVLDYYYFVNFVHEGFEYLFYGLLIYLFMFTLHFFSNTAHFDINIRLTLKNSLLMTLKNPVLSFIISLISILILFISFSFAPFLIPFFMGAFIAILSFTGFYRVCLNIPVKR